MADLEVDPQPRLAFPLQKYLQHVPKVPKVPKVELPC